MTFPDLTQFDVVAIDTETTGLNWRKDSIFGVSISTPDNRDYYWDIRQTPGVLAWLNDQLKFYNGALIGHTFKYDLHMFREAGVKMLDGKQGDFHWDCTMIRAALIDEHRHTYNLDELCETYLGERKLNIYRQLANLFGGASTRDAQIKNLPRAPFELVAKYAKRDTRLTLQLWEWQQAEIERVNMHKVCALERDVMYPIQDMEKNGIRIDEDLAHRQAFKLDGIIEQKKNELNKVAGFRVNPNPSQSIQKLFKPKWIKKGTHGYWKACDGTVIPNTPAGKPSFGTDTLRDMKHPAAAMIIEVRKLMRCRNTFIQGHIIDSLEDDRVYPNINQCKSDAGGTITGRLSYTKPALQQIPSRDIEISEIVRVLFLPDEGQAWYRADNSQSDARAFVHYTQSPPLMAAYAKDAHADFHSVTAAVTGLPRNPRFAGDGNAKQVGLGLLFCMGEGRLAKEMGMPYTEQHKFDKHGNIIKTWLKPGKEVLEIFETFHREIPGVKEFSKKATSVASSRGYLISLMGRHMHFPDGNLTYKAVAFLCQSATAEFNKVKLVDTYNMLKGTGSRLLLTVHDELNYSSDDDTLMKAVEKEMEDFHSDKARLKLRVPMVAEMNSGRNWYEAK